MALAAATAAACVVVGCSGSTPPAPGHMHTTSPPLSAPSGSTPATTSAARQAVIAAYDAYWTAGDKAERAGNAKTARTILGPYLTPRYINTVVSRMHGYWQRHEVSRGHVVTHVTTVRFYSGKLAVVVDCQDDTHAGLVSSVTGKTIPSSYGPPHAKLYASLIENGSRWRVDWIRAMGTRCTG